MYSARRGVIVAALGPARPGVFFVILLVCMYTVRRGVNFAAPPGPDRPSVFFLIFVVFMYPARRGVKLAESPGLARPAYFSLCYWYVCTRPDAV